MTIITALMSLQPSVLFIRESMHQNDSKNVINSSSSALLSSLACVFSSLLKVSAYRGNYNYSFHIIGKGDSHMKVFHSINHPMNAIGVIVGFSLRVVR